MDGAGSNGHRLNISPFRNESIIPQHLTSLHSNVDLYSWHKLSVMTRLAYSTQRSVTRHLNGRHDEAKPQPLVAY